VKDVLKDLQENNTDVNQLVDGRQITASRENRQPKRKFRIQTMALEMESNLL
jgi:hypothetical protein